MTKLILSVFLALLPASAAPAQTAHRCVDPNGHITYSGTPCPGAGENAGTVQQDSAIIEIADMTRRQADLAMDCEEVLANSNQPNWPERNREATDFNRYCPAFGFKVPLGPQTRAFNEQHAKELLEKISRRFARGPSTTRVYSGDRREPPTLSNAESILKERPSAESKSAVNIIPNMQPGLWKKRVSRNGNIVQSEECGEPFGDLRTQLLNERSLKQNGCTISSSSPEPHRALIALNCTDRGKNTPMSGTTEISIDAPDAQQAILTIKPAYGAMQTIRLTRLGMCKTPEQLNPGSQIETPALADSRGIAGSAGAIIERGTKRTPFQPTLPQNPSAPIIHAIGVYQALRGEVTVNVHDDSRPLILALSAYNKTHWTLKVADGVTIHKIILSGYHAQTISGMARGVPIAVHTYDPSPCSQCKQGFGYFYSLYEPHKKIEELAGQTVNTFQTSYNGTQFTISELQTLPTSASGYTNP